MSLTSQFLAEQVEQYIAELNNLTQHLQHKDKRLPHLKLLQEKISIKISHFQTALHHLRSHIQPANSLKQLSQHLAYNFSQIVKEAHRLLQLKPGEEGERKLKNKLAVLKQIEREMNEDWEGGFKQKERGMLRRIDEKTTMLAEEVDQTKLRAIAKEYLEKEFLAIRMAAYKMYQQYTAHQHSQIYEKVQQLYQEQEQFSREAAELTEVNRSLKLEEKRLMRELNDLRTTNQLISKRYFESGGSPEPSQQ